MERVFCDRCGCECTKDYRTGGIFIKQLGGRCFNYLCPSCDDHVTREREKEVARLERAVSKAEARARRHL
ncbi:MAG: hypothetical protein HYT73_02535 [Candidatus Aenigmarchaeota archaeon]|nr:hypothetical protein [Candidatus Aenigmarchaeota archaeon]